VGRLFPAPATKLLEFDLALNLLFVLMRIVIPPFADGASKRDKIVRPLCLCHGGDNSVFRSKMQPHRLLQNIKIDIPEKMAQYCVRTIYINNIGETIMKLVIPTSVRREVDWFSRGKKVIHRTKKKKTDEELLLAAKKNLRLLDEIAGTEPIYSLLSEKEGELMLFILNDAETTFDITPFHIKGNGHIVLAVHNGTVGTFFWQNHDLPSDRDFEPLTEEGFKKWPRVNLEPFAELTEKKIWAAIRKTLHLCRR
jgi:hypothetical protein